MSIHDRLWFFTVVLVAAVITSTGCLVPLVTLKIALTTRILQVLVGASMLVPAAIAALWMFRKLRLRYTRREAGAVAVTFLIFGPLALMAAIVVAEIPGGYAEQWLGSRFILIAVFASIPLVTALVSYVPCLFVLLITRHIMKTEVMH